MAVPRKKVTRQKRDQRRSHLALKPANVIEDQSSGEFRRSHHIDLKTGMYRGRQVITIKEKSADAE